MSFETCEQHKALRSTQRKRDYTDAMDVLRFLIERYPFEDCIHLMNVETGEVADNSVNVHDAKTFDITIKKNILGQSVFGYSYKRKDIVVNMSTKTVECKCEQISIDKQLLFQRLLANAGRDQVELEFGLCFELNSQPTSLFNNEGLTHSFPMHLFFTFENIIKQ